MSLVFHAMRRGRMLEGLVSTGGRRTACEAEMLCFGYCMRRKTDWSDSNDQVWFEKRSFRARARRPPDALTMLVWRAAQPHGPLLVWRAEHPQPQFLCG